VIHSLGVGAIALALACVQVRQSRAMAQNKRLADLHPDAAFMPLIPVPKAEPGLGPPPFDGIQAVPDVAVGDNPPAFPEHLHALRTMPRGRLRRLVIEFNEDGISQAVPDDADWRLYRRSVEAFVLGLPPGLPE
jgi:hypothetical protein